MSCGGLVVLGVITLPGVRESVANARLFLRDMLPVGLPALDDLVSVGSETVCNAIAHTASGHGGQVTVGLLVGEGLYRLEVADDGAGGRRPYVKAEDGTESGRGMRVVEALSERWGFRADGDRTVVWAEFRIGNSSGNSDRGLSPACPTLVPTACEEEKR
ncbi:ATP-binding protein [Actinomadura rubrisoli]|uniref:ATP-binding protein n=1 Tax=Actinomadura rubrisoli TaxID=2530368 RepID=A0A4R5B810_9ACTN|nr:ATP-binding protein [Actinomadura rubrisoli]TDD79814.1 ATP-binding protein [Actinomadura rubrisoli]